jgi:hypothetical protein
VSVDGTSEKVAVPFGAYLLSKSCCPFELRGNPGEAKRLPAPGPLLSHPMTCGRTNLNYTGSNTQVLSQGLQRTSNGVIPWPVG